MSDVRFVTDSSKRLSTITECSESTTDAGDSTNRGICKTEDFDDDQLEILSDITKGGQVITHCLVNDSHVGEFHGSVKTVSVTETLEPRFII